MQEFFKKMFFTGLKILLFIFIILIIYFLINYFFPHTFDRFRTQNVGSASSTVVENQSFGYRMYNLFFNSKKSNITQNPSSGEIVKRKSFWSGDGENTVWGDSSSTTWGSIVSDNTWGGGRSYDKLSIRSGVFISANTAKSPIQKMSINNLLINTYNKNILVDGSIMTGNIFTGFQSQYYFNLNIYDIDGNFLFFIPVSSAKDLKNIDNSTFYGVYNKNFNYKNYQGDGYMAIYSDDPNVEGIVLIKILIK
jgi:hypothetical protein